MFYTVNEYKKIDTNLHSLKKNPQKKSKEIRSDYLLSLK